MDDGTALVRHKDATELKKHEFTAGPWSGSRLNAGPAHGGSTPRIVMRTASSIPE